MAPKAPIKTDLVKHEYTELEQKIIQFVKNPKFLGSSDVPIVGATTVEIVEAFPDIKVSTLRFTVWHLRRKKVLVDAGFKRSLDKGKRGVVVWEVVGEV